MRIDDELVTRYNRSQTCVSNSLIVAQQISDLFENGQTVAQTVKPHHSTACVAQTF